MWHGYAYAALMFLTAFIQSLVLHQYFRKQTLVGMDMRTVIISAVYRKVRAGPLLPLSSSEIVKGIHFSKHWMLIPRFGIDSKLTYPL